MTVAADETTAPGSTSEDEVLRALRFLQGLIWTHPVAFQRAFAALVHEGRTFSATTEGAEIRAKLERAEHVARARQIGAVHSLNAFSEDRAELLPSVFLDAMAKAAASLDLEPLLARVFSERVG